MVHSSLQENLRKQPGASRVSLQMPGQGRGLAADLTSFWKKHSLQIHSELDGRVKRNHASSQGLKAANRINCAEEQTGEAQPLWEHRKGPSSKHGRLGRLS